MVWKTVSLRDVQAAMTECDQNGLTKFRELHEKFSEAKDLHMYLNGRGPYEARPLIAGAYAHANGNAKLAPGDFKDNDAHEFLEKNFGFNRVTI